MDAFFWIIAAALIGFGGFMNYINWKTYFKSVKAKKELMERHQDAQIEKVGVWKGWMYIALAVVCLVIGLFMLLYKGAQEIEMGTSQALVYLGLAVFAVAMAAEAFTESKVVYTPDGFEIEDTYVRYKFIRTVTVGKGMFKASNITLSTGKDIPVSNKMAAWVQQHFDEYKAARKDERKSRKQRRAEARGNRR